MELSDIGRFSPEAQQQILTKLGKSTAEKQNKYHAEKTCVGKMRFDSRRESARYQELMLMLKAGKIRRLKVQPEFTLQEAYHDPETGGRIMAIRYRADFSYEEKRIERYQKDGGYAYEYCEEWLLTVEDVKSPATRTRVYLNKRKMMQERFGITIKEV